MIHKFSAEKIRSFPGGIRSATRPYYTLFLDLCLDQFGTKSQTGVSLLPLRFLRLCGLFYRKNRESLAPCAHMYHARKKTGGKASGYWEKST
jgi:hypothetical protein